MFHFVKTLIRIVREYDAAIKALYARIDAAHNRIGEHTIVHADVHFQRSDQIIVVGRYRNRDYVRVFDLDSGSFCETIEMLKQMEPRARIGHFDMPGGVQLSAVYERDRL